MSNLSDIKGGTDLFGGSSYSFIYDRFCSPNSSFYFNHGFLQVPPGVYFSGDFTFTVWTYLKSYQSFSRILDFGNSGPKNNVNLMFYTGCYFMIGYVYRDSPLSMTSIIKN